MAYRKKNIPTKVAAIFAASVLNGSENEAFDFLSGCPGYQVIPGTHYMTTRMISRFYGVKEDYIRIAASKGEVTRTGVKGCWSPERPGLFNISKAIADAGFWDSRREIMDDAGIKLHNGILKLYDARAVLAIGAIGDWIPASEIERLRHSRVSRILPEPEVEIIPAEPVVPGIPAELMGAIVQVVGIAVHDAMAQYISK